MSILLFIHLFKLKINNFLEIIVELLVFSCPLAYRNMVPTESLSVLILDVWPNMLHDIARAYFQDEAFRICDVSEGARLVIKFHFVSEEETCLVRLIVVK